jgi:hypothetical protein
VAFFGARVGLTEREIAGTCAPDPAASGFPVREQLRLRLVDELHDTARVSDALWQALRTTWDEAQLIELVAR